MKPVHYAAAALLAAAGALVGAGAMVVAPAAAQTGALGVSGCVTIVAPGAYTLSEDAGTPSGDCIVVGAPDVTLNLGGHTLTGGNDAQSAGVHIAPGATGSVVFGGVIDGFGVGVEIDAPGASVSNVTAINSVSGGVQFANAPGATLSSSYVAQRQGFGVHLLNSAGAAVRQTSVTGSATYGIWIDGSDNTIVRDNDVHLTGSAAIYAGCVVDGQFLSATCPPERGVVIEGNTAVNLQGFGIVAGNNVQDATITHNSASSAGAYDLFDVGATCGVNTWSANTFRVANLGCIS